MNYRSCQAINNNFRVNEMGDILCPAAQVLVKDSLQRAYIFTNLYFYDITEREVQKLIDKINQRRETMIQSSNIDPDDVEHIFPNLSAQFKQEVGDNSLDPLIKSELAKSSRHLSLQLDDTEREQIKNMYNAICEREMQKLTKAVIITQNNKGKPYQINFSQKFVDNLPPRCKQFLKPTIKMLAYMQGLKFDQFSLNLYELKLTYTWQNDRAYFSEEELKKTIKDLIAG